MRHSFAGLSFGELNNFTVTLNVPKNVALGNHLGDVAPDVHSRFKGVLFGAMEDG